MKEDTYKIRNKTIIKTGVKITAGIVLIIGSFFIPACHKDNPGPKEVESTTAGTMTSGSAPVGTTSSTSGSTGTTSSTTSGTSSSTTSGTTSGTPSGTTQ